MKGAKLKLTKVTQGEELINPKNSIESKPATKTVPKQCVFINKDNNNPVSRRLPYSTEPVGSATAPEMALQSDRNTQPILPPGAGHVTERKHAQPITEQPRQPDQKCGKGGHLRRTSDQNEIGNSAERVQNNI